MPSYNTTYEAEHSAEDMFRLVADIESYPEFVPLCSGMEILSRSEEGEREILRARMSVAAGPVKEAFTNQVVLDRQCSSISVRAIDGPFTKLTNDWSFEPLGQRRCRIGFALDYEFRSLAYRLILGAISDTAFSRFAKAFEERADAVYRV